jgi:hypothetical protein
LVNAFQAARLPTNDVLIIEGHSQDMTPRKMMQAIIKNFGLKVKLSSPLSANDAFHVAKAIEKKEIDGYLIVHNVDGGGLRDPLTLELLSALTRPNGLHLIATLACMWGDIYWDQVTSISVGHSLFL